mgnify:CR=1 FL=1
MKRLIILILAIFPISGINAQDFDSNFEDATLRIDYIFGGDNKSQEIYFQQAYRTKGWYGRRTRLSEQFLFGNGSLTVCDSESHDTLYVTSFSTLFQEWQTEEEATRLKKSFENSYVIPFPRRSVEVTIALSDTHGKVSSSLTHVITPSDILIKKVERASYEYSYILHSGEASDCVDIAILPDGYTSSEMDKFYQDCTRSVEALFTHEPFTSLKSRFNVIAVNSPSEESGPCIPRNGQWHDMPCGTQYDTFYTDRYLMTSRMWQIYDILNCIPFEQIIVLVNSDIYGGGGIYNQINVFPSDAPMFKPLLVHEFGHGYGGLGDEYFYDDGFETRYPSDTEPWEPNLTTLVSFDRKWVDMIAEGTPIPTPPISIKNHKEIFDNQLLTQKVGVFEGGGYQSKGVYRPAQECRMKVLEVESFCPVCTKAIIDITDFYTGH